MLGIGVCEDEITLVELRTSMLGLILKENTLLLVGVTIICATVVILSKSMMLLIRNCGIEVKASKISELVMGTLVDELSAEAEVVVGAISLPDTSVAMSDDGITLIAGTDGNIEADTEALTIVDC